MVTTIIPKAKYQPIIKRNSKMYYLHFDADFSEEEIVTCKEEFIELQEPSYHSLIEAIIALKYTPAAETATINNYLADSEKYADEYKEYTDWRLYAKECARTIYPQ